MKTLTSLKVPIKLLWAIVIILLAGFMQPLLGQQKISATSPKNSNYVRGELIVRLADNVSPDKLEREWCEWKGKNTQLHAVRLLVKSLNIYLFSFDPNTVAQNDFLRILRADPLVINAQNNHYVTMRSTIPNDPLFDQQWQYINDGTNGVVADADIDADLAWDIATGGTTALGDTIVACVIDDGCAVDHPDWGDNLWINHGEIPNNNIDDDGNGYIDDYRGWNIVSNDDDIQGGFFGGWHGTCVAGIVGAKGNNGIGVSGVCWNVKVMIVVSGNSTNEADVLASYSYPLEMRTLYNATNGQEGAFVVSTNASWGIDQGQPADSPLWCAMYDELGMQGVLSCGATANANFNIDIVGDLPTACPSDYLISVTNMASNDVKVTQAGYGLTTIDLGAFGEGTYTIENGGGYAGFGGTSGATPHVTGSVALLYSIPCPGFIQFAKADPAAAALFVKQAILNGVDANTSLAGKCVTGGRLNLYNSVQEMQQYDCAGIGCITPYNVQVNNITTNGANVSWGALGEGLSFAVEYQTTGASTWTTVTTNNTSLALSDLSTCNDYEVQVTAICSDTLSSDASNPIIFTTDGCCVPPTVIMTELSTGTIIVTWEGVTAATQYNVQLINNGVVVQNPTVTGTNYTFTNTQPCTIYTVQIASVCGGAGNSTFSAPQTFTTPGCGACTDNNYCTSASTNVTEEWIGQVTLNTINNTTDGIVEYVDYTNLSTNLEAGGTYNIELTPGYSGQDYTETFRVWIDLDQNGDFEDQSELLFTQETDGPAVNGSIDIPTTAQQGSTRMRIAMKYTGGGATAPTACETFEYGQVEDYCVTITAPQTCAFIPLNVSANNVSNNQAFITWSGDAACDSYTVLYGLPAEPTNNWASLQTTNSTILLTGLNPLTTYNVVVLCNCGANNGEASAVEAFTTGSVGIESPTTNNAAVLLMPNPFTDVITIKWKAPVTTPNAEITWRLIDLTGRVVNSGQLQTNGNVVDNKAHIPTQYLTSGIYWVEIANGEHIIGRAKAIKIK